MNTISRRRNAALSLITLIVMGCLDYFTGYELAFSAAYLIPVSICAWHFSRNATLAMAAAGGGATWIVDMLEGRPYSHFLFQYWNSFTAFIICAVVGVLLHRLRATLLEKEQSNVHLRQVLAQLEESTREIRKLQAGLQVVCAWTNRLKVGDKWMTPDEFLTTQLNLKLSHGMSPEAARSFSAEMMRR